MRHAAEETPAFQQQLAMIKKENQEQVGNHRPKVSLREIVSSFWRGVLVSIGLVLTTNITYYILLTYMPSYLSHNLHYSEDHGVLIIIAIMIGMLFMQPIVGFISDKIGRKPFVICGSVALVLLAVPCFHLIISGKVGLIFLGLFILSVILNFFTGVMASTLPALFPTHIRYSALASSFNIAVIIAGLTPTIAAALVDSTSNLYIPAYYLMVIGLIGITTGIFMKETANRPLRGVLPSAVNKQEARELLVETYQHIEQSVDDIGTDC